MSPTLFPRQFLVTPHPVSTLTHWQHQVVGSWQIYAHPNLPLRTVEQPEVSIVLLGFALNPYRADESNEEIVTNLTLAIRSVEDVPPQLHELSGRFVLFIRIGSEFYVFHDPCGLRSVYHTQYPKKVIGSQPYLVAHATPLVKGDDYYDFHQSDYKKDRLEYWLPGRYSIYENVQCLLPNHYLRLSDGQAVRYWPVKPLSQCSLEEGVDTIGELLVNQITAAHRRYPLALPLTAGWDSRLLMACVREIAHDIRFYTLQYRELDRQSADIAIPARLLHQLGFAHTLIDCTDKMDASFKDTYLQNVALAHDDWGTIAYGLVRGYPADHVCLKGNCAEIGRCFYYKTGQHEPITTAEEFIQYLETYEKGWASLPLIRRSLTAWAEEAMRVVSETDTDLLDLFYWEHKMGSWQSQSQLEWDVAQEAFSPFSHRALLEKMLGIAPAYRCEKNVLYERIISNLWPDLLKEPINPRQKKTVKHYYRRVKRRLGW